MKVRVIAESRLFTTFNPQESSGRLVAAVCAAPTVFLNHGLVKGKKLTSYPAFKAKFDGNKDYTYCDEV